MYGHIYKMAEAIKQGVEEVKGAKAELRRVPETLPEEVLKMMGSHRGAKATHSRACLHGYRAWRGRRRDIRHSDPLRQHVRPDAPVFGRYRETLDERLACRKSRERIYEFQHPAWRPGIHHIEFSRNPPPPRHVDSRASLRLRRTDEDGRDNRRFSVRGRNHSRGKRSARSERKRACRSAVSGRSRGAVGAKLSK